jgi:hypothetical protein
MNTFILEMETKTLAITDKTFIQKRTGIPQKREVIKLWKHIEDRDYSHEEQLKLLKECIESNTNISIELQRQLKMKISSYKTQDIKHSFSHDEKQKKFNIQKEGKHCIMDIKQCITFEELYDLLISSELKCYYCCQNVNIIYRYMRDGTQWTLDRINNNEDHTKTNCVICCLKCNLERRRSDNSKFYIGKRIQYKKA